MLAVVHVRRVTLAAGTPVVWAVSGPRRCLGACYRGIPDCRPCPEPGVLATELAGGRCSICGPRHASETFMAAATSAPHCVLGLAWFGPGLQALSIAGVERGEDRMLEHGAMAHTGLAEGRWPDLHKAKLDIEDSSALGGRVTWPERATWWGQLPNQAERAAQVQDTYNRIARTLDLPPGCRQLPCQVVDNLATYGLESASIGPPPPRQPWLPAHWSTLTGQVRAVIGPHLNLDTAEGPRRLDARYVAGWHLTFLLPADHPPKDGPK